MSRAGGNSANPFTTAPVRYSDGLVKIATTDLSSDGFGFPWGQTRSWSNDVGFGSSGVNGNGWDVTQMPSLKQVSGSTLAVISNAVAAEYFDFDPLRQRYYPRFFDQFTLETENNLYVLTDEAGDPVRFNDFATSSPASEQGQFVSFTDPGGNVTSATWAAGQIQTVTRSSGALFEGWFYTYYPAGNANAGLLSNVALKRSTDSGSHWTVVRQVAYAYYDGSTLVHGNQGDLMTATVEDPGGNAIDTSYYRYYTPAELANPNVHGYVGGLEFVFAADSYGLLVGARGSNVDALTNEQVKDYANNRFEYDGSRRVSREDAQGAGCSACAGGIGTFTFAYTNVTPTPTDFNAYATKTVLTLPDNNQNIVYTNAYGEVMLSVYVDGMTHQQWVTYYQFDTQGLCILKAAPSAVNGYDDSHPDLAVNLTDHPGLITLYEYYPTNDTTPGEMPGYQKDVKIQFGVSGTPPPAAVLQETWTYVTDHPVHPVATDTVYRSEGGNYAETTTYGYMWSNPVTILKVTVTAPAVTDGQNSTENQNGPGAAHPDVTETYFDSYGRPIWTKDPDGYYSYVAYDNATGAVTTTVADVTTSNYPNFPQDLTWGPRSGLNLVTTYHVDRLGRTDAVTDPNQNVTYTRYNDANHEVRFYPGWSGPSGGAPSGPIVITRNNRATGFSETLTMAVPNNPPSVPDGTEPIANLRSLERDYRNMAGQVDHVYTYFNLTGLQYAPNAVMGTLGTNFYQTQYAYDVQGRPNKVVSPTGTITRTVYDGQGRRVSSWVGTSDSVPPQTYWSPSNPGGMIQVTAEQYDNGGVGDGYLTQETEYPAGNITSPPPGMDPRLTQYFYDWRGRMVATKSGVQTSEDATTKRPITYLTYDNLDEVTYTDVYDGNNVTLTMGSNGVPNRPGAGLLRAESSASYDYRGRVYKTNVYDVNQTTGNVSATLRTTNLYYDHRGNLIENAPSGGVVTKTSYDGAGRPTVVYTTNGATGTDWTSANTVAQDIVYRQQETQYDLAGNALVSTFRERFDMETGPGPLGNPTGASPKARVTYSGMYYDKANRLTASVNIGTNNPSLLTRPNVPPRSDQALVTSYIYDDAGRLQDVTDPRAIVSRSLYDALGRTVTTIANYTGGPLTNDSNRTVAYAYDGSNHVVTATATNVLPGATTTTTQQTQFFYGVTTDTGSDINSNDILAATLYPDPTTGQATTDQQVTVSGSPTGGTFTLSLRGRTTGAIDYNATAAVVQAALQGLTTVGAGNVQVTGPNGGPWHVHFTGALAGTYVPNLTADGTHLMGGTVAVATQQDTYTVNALGQTKAATDRNNHTTSYAYNVLGQTVTVTRPMTDLVANVTTMSYDTRGNLASVTDPAGHAVNYGYDGLHRRTSVTEPLHPPTTMTYDMRDNVTRVIDPLNHRTDYTYRSFAATKDQRDSLGMAA
jgi:YD repeat-containing protein